MSNRYHLTQQELDTLECERRNTRDKRYADRFKAVYLPRAAGKPVKSPKVLMMDREGVRNHHKRYRKGGLAAFLAPSAETFNAGAVLFCCTA